MKHKILSGCAALGLALAQFNPVFALSSGVQAKLNKSFSAPDAQEVLATREHFRASIARSYIPTRSGHLFFLTRKYFPVMFNSGSYSHDGFSHVHGKKLANIGDTHGMSWDYDVEIPIVLYGPSFVKQRQSFDSPATQQDLVPTYAQIMGAIPPRDALHGRVLQEALKPTRKKPKAILTLVFDQGGWQYYRAHKDAWPNVRRFMERGSVFSEARVTHLDVETAVGHTAIGTGAYPYQHGIMSNHFYFHPLGEHMSLLGPHRSPLFINSPSLADVWDLQNDNKALIFSYAYAERAAIGMAGHGSMYKGGDKDIVLAYSRKSGDLITNHDYYAFPDYFKGRNNRDYIADFKREGSWFGHDVYNPNDIVKTPAQVRFDADTVLKAIEEEAFGQDDITDLLYVTLKPSDACGHAFGHESDECGSVFAEQDRQFKRIIDAFERKVGKDNLLITLTADHGGGPLPGRVGGAAIKAEEVKAALNAQLDRLDNGVDLVYDMLASQVYVDEGEMRRNQLSWEDLRQALLNYRVEGQNAFLEVLTRQEVHAMQLGYGLLP